MSPEKTVAIIGGVIVCITFILFLVRILPKKVKTTLYIRKWRDIQKLCSNRDDWAPAIVHADMLLDEVLKKRKISGKTMGERLVNAQGRFSANDAVWSAHKLANLIRHEGKQAMKENDVKNALVSFRQALRDLGAL